MASTTKSRGKRTTSTASKPGTRRGTTGKRRPSRRGLTKDERAVGRPMRIAVLLAIGIGLVLAATATFGDGVQAQGGNTGTIKVHDGTSADPPTSNEPHVTGDVFVEGSNMAATEGTLQFFSWPPTGNQELILSTTWTADDGEPENHFLAGPFAFPCGHYRVDAQNGLEEDDFPGGVKSKMFWVDCEETPPPTSTTTSTTSTTSTTTTTSESETSTTSGSETTTTSGSETTTTTSSTTTSTGPPTMACPTDLSATTNDDGTVLLEWTPAPGSDGTNIYRAVGAGDFAYVTTVAAGVSSWLDLDAEPAGEYAYSVTGLYGNEESVDCPVVERSAIPDFPTIVGIGLASAGGLVAVLMRRRLA